VPVGITLVNNKLDEQFFFLYVYFNSLHIPSKLVLIIRRIICIDTSVGVLVLVCLFGLFCIAEFYVLLTVNLAIILVNDQSDAQIFFLYFYINSPYVSSNLVPIIRRINCINTRCTDTIDSPEDEHEVARNM
jgi:hypothetical protein